LEGLMERAGVGFMDESRLSDTTPLPKSGQEQT